MSAGTRRSLQVAVVTLGVLFFVGNLTEGVAVWDFLPLIAMPCGLVAVDDVWPVRGTFEPCARLQPCGS